MSQVPVSQLLPSVALIVRQCPTSVLIEHYVDAVREFCNRSRWLRDTVLGVTEAGTPQYNLGDDPHYEVCGIRAMSIQDLGGTRWTPITEGSATDRDDNLQNTKPEHYQYLPHGKFVLSATPDAIYNLNITTVLQPKVGAVAIDSSLLVDWTAAFKAGALHQLLRISGQPWTDVNESNNQLILFERGIKQAELSAAVGYNAGAATTGMTGKPNAKPRSRVLPI